MIIALQTLVFFRESFLTALARLLQPFFKHISLAITGKGNVSEDEESDDQVYSEYDDEKGVTFYPPMYAQRYAAVSDCLMDERWCGKLEKVVDFGHHDMSFIKYLKEVPGIRCILGVDIETIPLRCSSDLLGNDEYAPKRESPLQVTLFQGNAADPDYRLIGCDAVISIEMIEHMLPHDLERLVHNVFGFIKPWVAVFTTPNADFNELFKALEKNGLRRTDHLFEWTREQFHDWCSNIGVRYPNYTVTCQGIGPGPPGTLHYGCCSQLALFVSKDYHKQADLHLNGLALVANAPNPNNFSGVFGTWESSETITRDEGDSGSTLQPPYGAKCLTERLYPEQQSHMTLVISSTLCPSLPFSDPNFSVETFTYRDKILQCNLDNEIGKSFLMFDYEQYYDVVVPRRRVSHKVYEIEDVCSSAFVIKSCQSVYRDMYQCFRPAIHRQLEAVRIDCFKLQLHSKLQPSTLNCTTMQVKKFSKTTQNLMAKNKIDSLVHTREVVNEIRHLTKRLNFKGLSKQEDGTHIWNNINWGDNAPYWNQYYKIVREYIYPFEAKSDEVRILDLVSEEINRLIDTQYDEEFSVDVNRLEIPMSHLMNVVQHITDDVDRVRDLLEWNGYEIVDDVVIHSRLVVDTASTVTHDDEWQENDTFSDWDTADIRSTSVSDGSTIVPDYHGRCLRRALDNKVRNLRKMLSADEDITSELDRVVCRLMKLALRTSKRRQCPPPARWMQCKLLDLLTLTEKAIGRRRKHFIESFPVKAIEYYTKPQELELELEQDDRVKEIVDKYRHLLQPSVKTPIIEEISKPVIDLDIEDDFMSTTSNEFLKDFEYAERISPSLVIPAPVFSSEAFEPKEISPKENPLERTKAWVDEDVEVVPYPKHEMNYDNISSGDTDHSVSNARHKHKKSSKKHKRITNKDLPELETTPCKISQSKTTYKLKMKHEDKNKKQPSNSKIPKKVVKKKSNNNCLVKSSDGKRPSAEHENDVVRSKRKNKEHQSFVVKASKPIPESLIELSQLELKAEKDLAEYKVANNCVEAEDIVISNQPVTANISATENSFLIDIVTQDFEETIAMRRTIGTDAEVASEVMKKDPVETLSINFDENLCTKHEVSTENVQSQTIFLNDINEPSTSKGIRHNISTDVQCGPDSIVSYPMLSASTSLVKVAQVFTAGVKIHDVVADAKPKGTDFGTSTQDNNNFTTITPRQRSVGIKIKDSDVKICAKNECSTMTLVDFVTHPSKTVANTQYTPSSAANSGLSSPETKLLKPISSILKIDKSSSEFCAPSIASSAKTLSYFTNVPNNNTSNALIEASPSKQDKMTEKKPATKCARPKLCCGGVHVHSYRDKQVSEDIVYQGEWQRYRPKSLARKKVYSITTTRKSNEAVNRKKKENMKEKKVNSKEKVFIKRQEKKPIEAQPKKPIQTRNVKLHKVRQKDVTSDQIKKPRASVVQISTTTMRIPKSVKTVTKVASIIALSAISTKNAKSAYTVKKPAMLPNIIVNKDSDKPQKLKKSYIPLYLKKAAQNNLNKSIDSANTAMKVSFDSTAYKIAPPVRSKTEEIRKDLVKLSDELRENISYVVFRNDLKEKIESPEEQSSENTSDTNKSTAKQLEMLNKRTHSPPSLNSSTCSSPNSVATVRAASARVKNASNRRHSASSYKTSLTNSESDNPTPTKTKKIVRRCKSAKKPDSKDIDNKENIPESTRNFASKDKDKMSKTPFVGRHKSIYIAQVKTESSTTPSSLSRPKVQISNKSIKIPTPKDEDEKRKSNGPTVSRKMSLKSSILQSDTSSIYEELNQSQTESFDSSDTANMVLVLEPQPTYEELLGTHNISLLPEERAKCDNNLLAEWLQNSSSHSRHTSDIHNSMRHLLEETVDLIVSSYDNNIRDSNTVILSRDENENSNVDKVASPGSKTVFKSAENINSIFLDNDIQNPLNRTFDSVLGDESMLSLNNTRLTVTDLDLLSFKSITSLSKYSDYFMSDNKGNTSKAIDPTQNSTSVRDIFERKEPHMVQLQNAPGPLAVQAFSGYSLDAEPVTGDQPDSIALIDSETGSLALDINRQANSEELFVSGRSSGSYGSCLIDEDAVVPNWLFQIISQQQSVEEDPEPVLLGPVAAPLNEPLYDANGNVIEPSIVGVGAGAGDGRGMHSDHSQDSSGRGTSLSSSDTSSGPQSDVSAILIDPAAFTAQFELLRDPMASSVLVPVEGNPNDSADVTYRIDDDTGTLIGAHDDRTRTLSGASDIDADISSIDTDVPDLSDN